MPSTPRRSTFTSPPPSIARNAWRRSSRASGNPSRPVKVSVMLRALPSTRELTHVDMVGASDVGNGRSGGCLKGNAGPQALGPFSRLARACGPLIRAGRRPVTPFGPVKILANLKTVHKLTVAFGALLLAVAAVGWVGTSAVQRTTDNLDLLYRRDMATVVDIRHAQAESIRMGRCARAALLEPDDKTI